MTDYITKFAEGVKTLQDTGKNLLGMEDMGGWMLLRKTDLNSERRERLIAALPADHFTMLEVKRVLAEAQ